MENCDAMRSRDEYTYPLLYSVTGEVIFGVWLEHDMRVLSLVDEIITRGAGIDCFLWLLAHKFPI